MENKSISKEKCDKFFKNFEYQRCEVMGDWLL